MELYLAWEYNTDLFETATIEAMAGHFNHLLEAMLATPDTNVFQLDMLGEATRQMMLEQWNDTAVDYPKTPCIHELFIDQVQRTPDAIAVVDDRGEMTYLQVLAHAVALAKVLQDQAVDIEQLVAVRLPKGRDQLIATYAIMICGGAYLPLECEWPDDRCLGVIERAAVKVMLISDEADGLSHPGLRLQPMSVLDDVVVARESLLAWAKAFKACQKTTDLAYVIFTSGSTGVPKGVAVEHASVVNTLFDINAQYGITAEDKVLAVSALSFDLSVYDFFGMLAIGGQVVFVTHSQAKNPAHWLELVERHNITVWNTVPVSAGLLVEQLEFADRKSTAPLKHVLMSGDWIAPDLPARLWQRFEGCNLYSLGGATEGSIWSIHYPITYDTSHLSSIPYGKPLGGQQFYVLNSQLQPCPVGGNGRAVHRWLGGCAGLLR